MNDDNETKPEDLAPEATESSHAAPSVPESTFGQWMLEQRSAKGISLEDIASVTKIQLGMLKGIEANDYSKLPAPAFIRGFIVNFARFVGADEREAVERFRNQLKKSDSVNSLSAYLGQAASTASANAASANAAAAAASSAHGDSSKRELNQSGFGKNYNRPSAAMDMDATPIFTPKRMLIAGIALVVIIVCSILFSIGSKQHEPVANNETSVELGAPDDATEAEANAEAIASIPAATTETPTPPPPTPVAVPEVKKVDTTKVTKEEEKEESATYAYHLKLRGLDASWVTVRADQKSPQGSMLERGQTKDFYGNQRIVVALADAGSVEIFWNNKWYQPAGYRGDVKSLNLPDDLTKLKDK